MKLVSSVKLHQGKARRQKESKPYFDTMYETVAGMIAKSGQMSHPFPAERAGRTGKAVIVLITSNRGLAGGYNSNVVKLITKDERFSPDNTEIYAVGTKGRDALASSLGYESRSRIIRRP